MRDRNYLFIQYDLRASLQKEEKQMYAEIDGIDANRLLNTSVEDLATYFTEKYSHAVPQLHEDEITMDQGETKIDVSQEFDRVILNRSRPFFIDGTKFTFYVPFTGEGDLFYFQSSMITMNPPRAEVRGQELVITISITNHDAQAIKNQVNGTISQIKQLLTGVSNDIGIYNKQIKQNAENHIKQRREKLLKDQGLAADLGFKLRKREDAPITYTVPITLKKIEPQLPPASTAPFVPEPTLEWGQYDNILSIISNMVMVIERSPSTFSEIKEEDLRNHFLVQLNGQYNGHATGETFNAEGKTDILIRVDGKNIFIAECKFWKGESYLTEGIDQLLSYTSWRDTKTSILVFNRNKNLSEILVQIPEIFKRHKNFKREVDYQSETSFRYVFHQNSDKNREIIITVLVFDIPTEDKAKSSAD